MKTRARGTWFQLERIATVKVDRLRFLSLVVSALLSGAAGVVLASMISTGSPTEGTPYLLGAFAAAFLGATPLRFGRYAQRRGKRLTAA